MHGDERGESVTYATTREAMDAAVKPSAPVDDMIGWIDGGQDAMAITLDRLEQVLAPILGDPIPEGDSAGRVRSGSSQMVNRLAAMGSRGDDLVARVGRIISRVEV